MMMCFLRSKKGYNLSIELHKSNAAAAVRQWLIENTNGATKITVDGKVIDVSLPVQRNVSHTKSLTALCSTDECFAIVSCVFYVAFVQASGIGHCRYDTATSNTGVGFFATARGRT